MKNLKESEEFTTEKKLRIALICSIILTAIGATLCSLSLLTILGGVLTFLGCLCTFVILIAWISEVTD